MSDALYLFKAARYGRYLKENLQILAVPAGIASALPGSRPLAN